MANQVPDFEAQNVRILSNARRRAVSKGCAPLTRLLFLSMTYARLKKLVDSLGKERYPDSFLQNCGLLIDYWGAAEHGPLRDQIISGREWKEFFGESHRLQPISDIFHLSRGEK